MKRKSREQRKEYQKHFAPANEICNKKISFSSGYMESIGDNVYWPLIIEQQKHYAENVK